MSLNEALFFSPRGAEKVRAIAQSAGCELVVADMIRTVPLARATGAADDRGPGRPALRALPLARASRAGTTRPSSATTRSSCPSFVSKPAGWLAARLLRPRGAHRRPARGRGRTRGRRRVARGRRRGDPAGGARRGAVACLPMAVRIPTRARGRALQRTRRRSSSSAGSTTSRTRSRCAGTRSEVASRMAVQPRFRLSVVGACPDGVRSEARVARDPVPRIRGRRRHGALAPPSLRGPHGRGHRREDQGARGHGRRAAGGDHLCRSARPERRGRCALPGGRHWRGVPRAPRAPRHAMPNARRASAPPAAGTWRSSSPPR